MQDEMDFVLEILTDKHPVHQFACEDEQCNDYLRDEALEDMNRDVARTFVGIDRRKPVANNVAGFFTLRADALQIKETYFEDWMDKVDDDKTPTLEIDVPLVELMWLARDSRYKGIGIGDTLMIEVLKIVKHASDNIGIIGLHLRSTSKGQKLYDRYDFEKFTEHPAYDKNRYILSVKTIRKIVAQIDH